MYTRRKFLTRVAKIGTAAATAPLWSHLTSAKAFAQSGSTYKAVVVINLEGGNDGNNMIIPLDRSSYAAYSGIRRNVAVPIKDCLPMATTAGAPSYGFHPALVRIAGLYNARKASAIVNAGPLAQPCTRSQLLQTPALVPGALLTHPSGMAQWLSAETVASPSTGWGGRIADHISYRSGSLPPILNTALGSVFTVGNTVQGVAVQGGDTFLPLPPSLNDAILQIANADAKSANAIVAQAAKVRAASMQQQAILNRAKQYGTLRTGFPASGFGNSMKTIADVINGRSIVGASRQIFYATTGGFDTHQEQLRSQNDAFAFLDAAVGSFYDALIEMGLENDVLICTHSDFGRSFAPNNSGSDHGWGNHQLIFGGGYRRRKDHRNHARNLSWRAQ